MTGRPTHSREDSSSNNHHRPAQPSTLRQSHAASSRESSQDSLPAFSRAVDHDAVVASESTPLIPSDDASSRRRSSAVHPGVCEHGTFSPRPLTPTEGFGYPGDDDYLAAAGAGGLGDSTVSSSSGEEGGWKKWFTGRIRTKKMGQSRELAQRAGFQDSTLM